MKRLLLIFPLVLLGAKDSTGCPQDMVRVPKTDVCIDRFEWPNEKGVKPAVAMTSVVSLWDRKRGDRKHNAEDLCQSVGKRLCDMTEWVDACKGKRGADYPFGRKLPKKRPAAAEAPCNYAQWFIPRNGNTKIFKRDPKELARMWQGDRSGDRGCVSASGAEDMMGNVEEWVTCPRFMSRSGKNCVGTPHKDQVCYCLAGRFWSAPVKCREMIAGHAVGWHDYQTGFRCCKNAED